MILLGELPPPDLSVGNFIPEEEAIFQNCALNGSRSSPHLRSPTPWWPEGLVSLKSREGTYRTTWPPSRQPCRSGLAST